MKRNPLYNVDGNIAFQPDVISNVQEFRDETGNLIRVLSDIEYILHNQAHKKYDIPANVIRDYIDRSQDIALSQTLATHKFTDEELCNALIPHEIGTITDAYQFSKYLQSHNKSLKDAISHYLETIQNK